METETKPPDYRALIGGLIGLVVGVVLVVFWFWPALLILALGVVGWIVGKAWPD
jgi:uncharacterized membrane protein